MQVVIALFLFFLLYALVAISQDYIFYIVVS